MSAAAPTARDVRSPSSVGRLASSCAATAGPSRCCVLLGALLRPRPGHPRRVRRRRTSQSLATGVLPVAFAAAAQTVVVISGGIDLSVGAVMAFTSVVAAVLMQAMGDGAVGRVVVLCSCSWAWSSARSTASLVVVTRVPDIIVTLAMSFVWAGAALLVLNSPAGPQPEWFKSLSVGSWLTEWLPTALVCWRLRHRRRLAAAAAVAPGPLDLCRRQRPDRGPPERRRRAADQDRGVRDRRPVRGDGRPRADDEHRHRHADARARTRSMQRRGRRARRREPGRRPWRHARARSSRRSSWRCFRTTCSSWAWTPNYSTRHPGRHAGGRGHGRRPRDPAAVRAER